VQFFKNGAWTRVTVDDRFPVLDNVYYDEQDATLYKGAFKPGYGSPAFVQCRTRDEFWMMIVEKACVDARSVVVCD
jgi:hypothetical protein